MYCEPRLAPLLLHVPDDMCTNCFWGWRFSSAVEHLPGILKALGLSSDTTKVKEKIEKNKENAPVWKAATMCWAQSPSGFSGLHACARWLCLSWMGWAIIQVVFLESVYLLSH